MNFSNFSTFATASSSSNFLQLLQIFQSFNFIFNFDFIPNTHFIKYVGKSDVFLFILTLFI